MEFIEIKDLGLWCHIKRTQLEHLWPVQLELFLSIYTCMYF